MPSETMGTNILFWPVYPPPYYTQMDQTIKILKCPSNPDIAIVDGHTTGGGGWIFETETWNSGGSTTLGAWLDNGVGAEAFLPLARCDYMGVDGVGGRGDDTFWNQYQGILGNRAPTRLEEITNQDGTSNTVMVGEVSGLGGADFGFLPNTTPTLTSTWANGMMWGVEGLCQGSKCSALQFSSNHPGVVQFLLGDGSVHAVRIGNTANIFSPDWFIWAALCGWKDGLDVDYGVLMIN
jgi:hypothetical protein